MRKFLLLLIVFITPLSLFAQDKVNNIVAPVSYFINHVQQLNQIKNNLSKYRQASIVGISGMGKTQLARMYAYENKDNYNLIWFIDCNLNINDELLKLARAINKAKEQPIIAEEASTVKKQLMEYLGQSDKWLLIFDNLKINENKKIEEFINWEHNGNIIFCSQDSEILPYIIKVTPFKKQETVELANNILEDKDDSLVEFLVQEFKGYPVLTVQGAQILNNVKGLNKEEYKNKIHKSTDKISFNISLVIEQLKPTAKQLLNKIALLNTQSFSKDLLGIITDSKNTLDDDIFQLSKFALISNIDPDEANPIFEMHDVITQKILDKNSTSNNKYLENLVAKFLDAKPKSLLKGLMYRNAKTVPENIEMITKNAEKYNISTYKLLELKLQQIDQCDTNYDLIGEKELVDWFDENDKAGKYKLWIMNNEEKRVYADYLDTIGWYYGKSSNFQMSIEYFSKAKKVFEDVKGYESLKANVIYGLINVYVLLGDVQGVQKNIEILEQKLDEGLVDNSDRTMVYASKARLFFLEGKYNEALEQINLSIQAVISSGLSPDALFLTTDYLIKSETLSKLGHYKEALAQAEQVYNMQKRVKKETSEIFGRIYTQMAMPLFGLGEGEKALEHVNKALEIFKNNDKNFAAGKMVIVTNPRIANAYVVQGDILFTMDKLEEALSSYRQAQGIYFNLYKENSKNVAQVSYLNLQGAKAACKKKDQRMYKCFGEPQVMQFGLENPNTIEMFKYCESYDMHLSKKKTYIKDKSN
ncbi:tetratricopeptide repeat protein [Rickettsia endosymbiont of Orchestes rusci]|uniref:tetratricopeptide repeat protein n=1 Tax=Rickettsia endosymbiont of Orchestes rusci TaxID=3066250 RepID=UPI00313B398C